MDGLKDVISSSVSALAKAISASSPLVASVLGTPLAGVAVSLLSSLFGTNPKNVDEILGKINSDPEAIIKIKTLEYEHAETLAKISAMNYSTEVDDRKNARNTLLSADEKYKEFIQNFAFAVTLGFFLTLAASLIISFIPGALNSTQKEFLSMLLGVLGSKWQTIVDFFYGSSHRS